MESVGSIDQGINKFGNTVASRTGGHSVTEFVLVFSLSFPELHSGKDRLMELRRRRLAFLSLQQICHLDRSGETCFYAPAHITSQPPHGRSGLQPRHSMRTINPPLGAEGMLRAYAGGRSESLRCASR